MPDPALPDQRRWLHTAAAVLQQLRLVSGNAPSQPQHEPGALVEREQAPAR